MSIIEKAMKKVSAIDKPATHPETKTNIVQTRTRVKTETLEPFKSQNLNHDSAAQEANEISQDQAADKNTIVSEPANDAENVSDTSAKIKTKNISTSDSKKFKPMLKSTDDFAEITKFLQSKKVLPVSDKLLAQNAEEYRIIKRPIINNAFGNESQHIEHGNLLLVTSALPNEGKTNVAINIALSIAHEVNHTVLLIDADIAKADTSRHFEIDDQPGLTDLLVNDSLDVEDVIIDSGVPGFKIIPAGSDLTVKNELLASMEMRELLDEISKRYSDRMVVLDSPPLLVTAESRVISSLAGQIALVVEAARTPKPQAIDAVNMLDSKKPVNVIMNKTNRNFGFGQYGTYSYGYGIGTRRKES